MPTSFFLKIYVTIVRMSQNLNIFSHYSLFICIFSEDQRKVKYFSKATNGIPISKMLHNGAFLPNIRERKKCQEIVSLKYKRYVIVLLMKFKFLKNKHFVYLNFCHTYNGLEMVVIVT